MWLIHVSHMNKSCLMSHVWMIHVSHASHVNDSCLIPLCPRQQCVTCLVYVWHDSSMCDMTHSNESHSMFMCVISFVYHCNALQRTATHCSTLHTATNTCDMTHRYLWYGLCGVCEVTHWYVCSATHCNTLQHTAHCNTYVWHDSSIRMIWLVWYVWHDSLIRVMLPIDMCYMIHDSYIRIIWLVWCVWRDSLVCVILPIDMCYMTHDSYICVPWLIRTCDTAQSHMCTMNQWYVNLVKESCHTYGWVMSHIWMSHVTHMDESQQTYESVTCATWLIQMCSMTCSYVYVTYSYVRHDSFVSTTWLIHMCDMTHSCVRHDSCICVTWLIRKCDMTHS